MSVPQALSLAQPRLTRVVSWAAGQSIAPGVVIMLADYLVDAAGIDDRLVAHL